MASDNINKRISELIELYMDGQSTSEDEALLRDYFATTDDIPAQFEYARMMFGFFGSVASQECSGKFTPPIAASRSLKGGTRRVLWFAASVAAVVALMVGLHINGNVASDQPPVYCYVNGEPVTDMALTEELLNNTVGKAFEAIGKTRDYLTPIEQVEQTLDKLQILDIINNLKP